MNQFQAIRIDLIFANIFGFCSQFQSAFKANIHDNDRAKSLKLRTFSKIIELSRQRMKNDFRTWTSVEKKMFIALFIVNISKFCFDKMFNIMFHQSFCCDPNDDSLNFLIWHIIRIQRRNFVNLIYQRVKVIHHRSKSLDFLCSIETKTSYRYHRGGWSLVTLFGLSVTTILVFTINIFDLYFAVALWYVNRAKWQGWAFLLDG